jgi:hypothetical protein
MACGVGNEVGWCVSDCYPPCGGCRGVVLAPRGLVISGAPRVEAGAVVRNFLQFGPFFKEFYI